MLRAISLLILLSTFSQGVLAEIMSPIRDPKIPWEDYFSRAAGYDKEFTSALKMAVSLDEAEKVDTKKWKNYTTLEKNFRNVRNDRYLGKADFPRRIPWFYTDDGCYTRAALINLWMKNKNIVVPGKVFAFGKLRAKVHELKKTSYWWYHVAPIIQVGKVKYVLDPAVESRTALTLREWVVRMAKDPKSIKVAICSAGTYLPGNDCKNEEVISPVDTTINHFLSQEWNLVRLRGKSPEDFLGENPPWK